MLVFISMLVPAAEKAGMKVPTEEHLKMMESGELNGKPLTKRQRLMLAETYPHFHVFATVQLQRRMQMGEQWGNAEVVASIPLEQIKSITLEALIARGLRYSS